MRPAGHAATAGDPSAPTLTAARRRIWLRVMPVLLPAVLTLLQYGQRSEDAERAPTAIVATGGQGHIVEFNPAAERLSGLAREQVPGRVVGDAIIPERQRAAHAAETARLRAGERVAGFDGPVRMPGRRADGSEFPVEMLAFHTGPDGESVCTGFIADLTARQQAARLIERQREALRQSEKLGAMGTLPAGVARRIREAAERCGRIVRAFLGMARAKPPERSTVRFDGIVRAAADLPTCRAARRRRCRPRPTPARAC